MSAQAPALSGKALITPESFAFWFETAASSGRAHDAIVCDGVAVQIVVQIIKR